MVEQFTKSVSLGATIDSYDRRVIGATVKRKSRARITFTGMKLRLKVKKIFTFSEFSTSTQSAEPQLGTQITAPQGTSGLQKTPSFRVKISQTSHVQATKVRSK